MKNTQEKQETAGAQPENVCPNCGQWQNWTSKGYYDCFHDCAGRGFAPKRPTPAFEKASAPETRIDIREAYDIKNVDFRNLLSVVMGTVSNQTGESFDSAMLRTKSADEILRRYNEARTHAEQLAAALADVLGGESPDFKAAKQALDAWEGAQS